MCKICQNATVNLERTMTLFEMRKQFGITQDKAAKAVGVPLRTYARYEEDESYGNFLKRTMIEGRLNEAFAITEDRGVLSPERIQQELTALFKSEYPDEVEFCYLFGSYAKGYATAESDVDLCLSTSLTGIRVAGLAERIRNVLHKKIDLVRVEALVGNPDLLREVLKDGIKVYG